MVEVGVEGVFGVGGGVVSDEDVGGESVEDGEEGACGAGGVEVEGDGAGALSCAELVDDEGFEVGVGFVEVGGDVGGDGGAGEVGECDVGFEGAFVVEGEALGECVADDGAGFGLFVGVGVVAGGAGGDAFGDVLVGEGEEFVFGGEVVLELAE